MRTTIKTLLTTKESDLFNLNPSDIYSFFEANNTNDASDEFNISSLDIKRYIIDYNDKDVFSMDLFNYIKKAKDNCSLIHIFCYLSTSNPVENPSPVRFQLKVNSDAEISFSLNDSSVEFGDPSWISLGSMSQFTTANNDGFPANIMISNFDLSSGEKCNLVIITGYNE